MEFMEVIKGRRSVRKFKDLAVGEEIIEELLKAAQMAPSAGNLQARDFIIVTSKITKQKLTKAALGQSFIEQAPVVIVVIANIERSSRIYRSRGELYAIQDATAGIENMLLTAYSMGLGTCWIGAFDENAVSELLGIPDKTLPVAIISAGYPDEQPVMPPRIAMEKIVHRETW
ncbi:MAG: nitroreductase family protein [Candidatus Methanoperedens sp.]|nr:nitroreductase family protein [Candidatus Methanoperedens sp.]